MTKQPFNFDNIAQEAANQSREGFEAFSRSGAIFAKGYEELLKTAAALTQSAVEQQAEYAKELMGSKSINDYADKQNKIAQANYEQFMETATKLSEMSVKVLSDASEPLNSQVAKAMNNTAKKAA